MNFIKLTLILALLAISAAEQWYELGNPKFLDWNNFDQAVSEPNTYKFVKYFTHTCRYCRLIKQVEEELQAERNWNFKFYQVDCTLHYDLCAAKASPSAFPYVGVYNLKGELQAQIGGYYPLDTMREAFKNIEGRQIEALKAKGIHAQVQTTQKKQVSAKPHTQVNQHQQNVKADENSQNMKKAMPKSESGEEDRSKSIAQGIKILLILVGFWLFQKQIKPYLKQQNQPRSRVIEIPIPQKSQTVKAQNQQANKLLSDTL